MSAFAFFGGMAEEYSEIEAAKVKAAAKKAKDDKEAQEDRFTLLRSDGTPVFEEGFTARKGSGGIDQVVAGEVAFSQELDNKLKAFKSVFETKDKDGILYKDYSEERLKELSEIAFSTQGTEEERAEANSALISAAQAKNAFDFYNTITTNPFFVNQVRSQTSNAQQKYLKSQKIGEDEFARPDYRIALPYLDHFPDLRKRFEDMTNVNYKELTTPNDVWNYFMTNTKGENWQTQTQNAGGLTDREKKLKDFSNLYGQWKDTGFSSGPEKNAAAEYFLKNDMYKDIKSVVNLVSGYYPEMNVDSKFPGTISSVKLDQTDKVLEKKSYLTIDTTKSIARLTQSMRDILLELGTLRDDKGQLVGTFSGSLPLTFQKFYDNIFAQGGAADYVPKLFNNFVTQIKNNKIGNKDISEYTNFIQIDNETLTLREFLDREFEYKNEDGKEGTITGRQALENSSQGQKTDYWENKIGLAGLYLSSEISLAFTLAIARQDFEGGKAVSDPDFERSLQEARAGGETFGFANAAAKFKKFDSLIVEFSRRALPNSVYTIAKNQNKKHALKSVSNDLTSLINLADTAQFGEDIPNQLTGRFLHAGVVLDDEVLYNKILNNKYYNYGSLKSNVNNSIRKIVQEGISGPDRARQINQLMSSEIR
jgi:hypothetical protein